VGPITVRDAAWDYYVRPAIVEMPKQTGPVEHETFAPIFYIIPYNEFDAVLTLHNAVPQGLPSDDVF
jgi:aldehyde dehydrogenase (NAD+)